MSRSRPSDWWAQERAREQRLDEALEALDVDDLLDRPEMLRQVVTIWQEVVDVQKHFNQLGLQIRALAVTFVGALLGLVGVAGQLAEGGLAVHVVGLGATGTDLSLPALVVLAGMMGWLLFGAMDLFWYHRLLLGITRAGIRLEMRFADRLPFMALSTRISHAITTRIPVLGWRFGSTPRLWLFYGIGAATLLGLVIALQLWAMQQQGQLPT